MKVWLFAIVSILTPHRWGMNYYIEANVKNTCGTELMGGTYALSREFSNFFAAVNAYDNKSEIKQVEQILKIDLSTFQQYDYINKDAKIEIHWKDIYTFNKVLDNLLNKIKVNPSYYKKVKYNPVEAQHGFSTDSAEMQKIFAKQREHENHPMHGYPNDWSYLSSGQLVNDVKELKTILKCYMRSGATKIQLTYM